MAARLFPTVLEPLRSRAEMRSVAADDEVWRMLFERPVSEAIETTFADDTLRGIVADGRADRDVLARRATAICARTAASSTT